MAQKSANVVIVTEKNKEVFFEPNRLYKLIGRFEGGKLRQRVSVLCHTDQAKADALKWFCTTTTMIFLFFTSFFKK